MIAPTQGGTFSIESSVVGWILGGTQDYYRLELDMRRFIHLGSSRVLALRTKVGRMERLSPEAKKFPRMTYFIWAGVPVCAGGSHRGFIRTLLSMKTGKRLSGERVDWLRFY